MQHRAPTVVVGFILLTSACVGTESATTSSTTATTVTTAVTAPTTLPHSTTIAALPPANEAVIGRDRRPDSLNPLAPGGDDQVVLEINQALGIGLTETDGETLELTPDLVVEIPSVANGDVIVADDGTTTVTFRLRPDAVWADGAPIAGGDIVFTYESIMALDDRPFFKEPYEAITGIDSGDHSVTLTFHEPTLSFEVMFPFVIPRHQVEGTDAVADWLDTPWMSAGPFTFESWESDELVLVRNEAFWKTDPKTGEPLPHLDRLRFKWIPETDRLIDAFAAGEIDVARLPPWPATIDRLAALDGVEVTVRDSTIWEHFTFQFGEHNPNPESLNQHVEFRRAIAHLIDRRAIVDLGFWGTKTALDSVLDLHGLPTDHPWAAYRHDPAAAEGLLTALCTDLGRDCQADPPRVVFTTTGNGDERPAIGRLLVDLLAVGGIEVELDLQDSSLFFGSTLEEGAWDLGMWAWSARPDPTGVLRFLEIYDPLSPITGDPNDGEEGLDGTNWVRWGTPQVGGFPEGINQGPSLVRDEHTERFAETLNEMRTTADHEVFATLARQAERILAEQVVIIPLLTRSSVGAVWTDRVLGHVHSPWLDTWNVEEWRRADL